MTWSTTDDTVVTVNNSGYVTAVGIGVATITATSENGLTASCVITVSEDAPALVLDTLYTVEINNPRMQPLLKFTPEESGGYAFYSTRYSNDPVAYLYDENMKQLAADDDSGEGFNFRIVRSLEAGKIYYLRPCFRNSNTGSIDVKVEKMPAATSMTLSCGEELTVTRGTVLNNVSVGFQPDGCIPEAVTWSTTDDTVATVNNGMISAVGFGVATITATSENGLTASCLITVVAAPTRGDATGDGAVTIDDATEIQRYLAEFDFDDTTRLMQCGDVTGDNKITIADVTAIQRYLADIENINNIGQQI